MFLMGTGTIHRFPEQWLIISLFYPPRQRPLAGTSGIAVLAVRCTTAGAAGADGGAATMLR